MSRHDTVFLLFFACCLVHCTMSEQFRAARYNIAGQRVRRMDMMSEMRLLMEEAEELVQAMQAMQSNNATMTEEEVRRMQEDVIEVRRQSESLPVIPSNFVNSETMNGMILTMNNMTKQINKMKDGPTRSPSVRPVSSSSNFGARLKRFAHRVRKLTRRVIGEPDSAQRNYVTMGINAAVSLLGTISSVAPLFG